LNSYYLYWALALVTWSKKNMHYTFKNKNIHRKGYSLAAMGSLAIIFVVITIIISFGSTILDEIAEDQTAGTYERNATDLGNEALGELGSWLPTLALVVVAAIIIGIVVMYLGTRVGGRGV